jgi:hypothetical protein
MMNLDGARAGGEGMLAAKKKPDGKDKNIELDEQAPIFETEEQPIHLKVPEGWSVGKQKG